MEDREPGKTLIIGSQSYLGRTFSLFYRKFYPDTIETDHKSLDPISRLNLLAPDLEPLQIKSGEYKWALVTAGITSVSFCERQKALSFRVNVEGTLKLVEALVKKDIIPIIFSSDYVYDGELGNYSEDDAKNPVNEYGRQKDLLESALEKNYKNLYLILRCGKIYGLNKGDGTLIDQITTSLSANQPIQAAYDQFFAPIHEVDVVRAVLSLQSLNCRGVFNLSGSEIWSRLELVKKIASILGVERNLVQSIALKDLGMPYTLPRRTYMKCDKIYNAIGFIANPVSEFLWQLSSL